VIVRHQALRACVAEQLAGLTIRSAHRSHLCLETAAENQIDTGSGKGFFRSLLKVKSRLLLLRRIRTAVTDRRRHQIQGMGFRRMLSRFQSEAIVVEKPSTLSCTAPTLAIGRKLRMAHPT
jgi:hypothetical protein